MPLQPRLQNLKNKKILAEVLNLELQSMRELLAIKDTLYRETTIPKSDGKDRKLQIPKGRLVQVHRIVRKDLCKLGFPAYLHSGVKKRSSLSNANHHADAFGCLTVDIREFYPSCSKRQLKSFLLKELNQTNDVADILSELITFKGHVPTGSTLSQIIAFFCAKSTFDEIWRYCLNRELKLTVYVDDISISSTTGVVPAYVMVDVRKILRKSNLFLKRKKTRLYGRDDAKRITGVIVKGERKEAPYSLRKKLFVDTLPAANGDVATLAPRDVLKALGLVRAIRQIEGAGAYPQLYFCLRKLERGAQAALRNAA